MLLKARKKVQVSGHIHFEHILCFRISPGYLNFKVIIKLFPEQIQNSGILRTRDILKYVKM